MVESGTDLLTRPDGWWVTGIVDGEGCFYASTSFKSKRTSAGNMVPCVNLFAGLSVYMRDDDARVVEKIKDYFGFGLIQHKSRETARKRGVNAGDAISIRLYDLDLIVERMIPHFEAFPLQSKKADDYDIWRDLVLFVHGNLRGKKGWLRRFPGEVGKVVDFCERLKEVRVYHGPAEGMSHG